MEVTMRTITVSLAGREYSIQQLPIKANRAWREKFEELIGKLVSLIREGLELSSKKFPNEDGLLKAVSNLLAIRLEDISQVLVNSIDMVEGSVFEYAPEIAADREWIEDEAFDDELIAVFMKVVQLAYPFGQIMSLAVTLGHVGAMTSPSSPGPNGASGKTSSMKSRKRVS
jgi:hypothetical protein